MSIILPTHDRADVLPWAIRSALWQTFVDFELLVVADGCTDDTADVVRAFPDPRVRLLEFPKAPGVGYANRNRALRLARGATIAYLAHDDLWFPDHLQVMATTLARTHADFAHSRCLDVDDDGVMRPAWFNVTVPAHRRRLLNGTMHIGLSNVVHTRRALEACGYWDESLLEGADLVQWAGIVGTSERAAAFVPQPTALRFVAPARRRQRLTSERRTRLLGSRLLQEAIWPPALRLSQDGAAAQQRAAFVYLQDHGAEAVTAIRNAVVRLQDDLSGATEGWFAFVATQRLARGLAALRDAALTITTPERRSLLRARQRAIRQRLAIARREEGAGD